MARRWFSFALASGAHMLTDGDCTWIAGDGEWLEYSDAGKQDILRLFSGEGAIIEQDDMPSVAQAREELERG